MWGTRERLEKQGTHKEAEGWRMMMNRDRERRSAQGVETEKGKCITSIYFTFWNVAVNQPE